MNPTKSPLKSLLIYWPLIVAVVGLIIGWTTFQLKLETVINRIATVETKASASEAINNQILTQLSQIQTDISWIKLRIQ